MNLIGYNYKERKAKVEEILDETNNVIEVPKFPKRDKDFTYTNGYRAWAGAIFVDLRDSTSLFSKENDIDIAKVIRGFTSEIIEILRSDTDDDMMEIGIRGDCVYAIYSVNTKDEIFDIAKRAFYINTYMNMLNKLLIDRKLPTIRAGIGLDTTETLAVKAGRASSGINSLVWIGESVAIASKLSGLGNKDGIKPIVMSPTFYSNYIDIAKSVNEKSPSWWTRQYSYTHGGCYYDGNVIITEFDEWINNGMNP
ncbi:adenylate cyclase (plasmid) [Bacillus velezensis]|uniref:adenylate/guanylate cyclase domain-containing protein n=1 Tax=Bacillus velezensis TaxID=492670 RepID=UPI00195D1C21|nr:adenylate/guanylate cyclase domain-containing protein [Bacillus velezensis]QRV11494.1 adenylate cyclase [Bacillus velezensis]